SPPRPEWPELAIRPSSGRSRRRQVLHSTARSINTPIAGQTRTDIPGPNFSVAVGPNYLDTAMDEVARNKVTDRSCRYLVSALSAGCCEIRARRGGAGTRWRW